ncbi:MAG: hypothetical protein WBC44_07635 [Planctomycetaceae bacterium]
MQRPFLFLAFTAAFLSLVVSGCGGGAEPDPKAGEVAKWVLRRGGSVRARFTDAEGNDVNRKITDSANLPTGGFALEEIDLNQLPTNVPPIRDEELKVLEGLTNLQKLGLYGSNLSDKGTETIAGLKSLRELELSQTLITDAGLETLSTLPNLESLFLRNVGDKVTDEGVKAFERRTGAKVLH